MWVKIFFSSISVIFVLVISLITFFWWIEKASNNYLKVDNKANWKFFVDRKWTWSYIENDKLSTTSTLFLERFDYLDKIISDKNYNYSKTSSWENILINIEKWKFFFFLWNSKKYEIVWPWLKISLTWPAKFYIDSENFTSSTIFSIDNILDVSLIWLNDNLEKTKVYLYPHTIFTFNAVLNRVLNNSDILRISQINDINFFNWSIYKSSLEEYDVLNNIFFKESVDYLYYEYLKIKDINIQIKNNNDLSFYDDYKKYLYLLVNINKKSAYIKELIYINLLKIYSWENSDWLFLDTQKYFGELKSINLESYNEMLNYLIYFKNISIYEYNLKIDSKDFDNMYYKLFWLKHIESNYLLYTTFNSYDLGETLKFYNWINLFSDNFLIENWLKISNSNIIWYEESKNIALGYYILFLDNIIKSTLSSEVKIGDVKYIFGIFNKYSTLSLKVYSWLDEKKWKSLIIFHLKLLKSLSSFLRNTFFEDELEKWRILVTKKDYELDNNLVTSFDNSFNSVLDFFYKNKWTFDENNESDNLNLNDFDEVSKKISTYISALKNYDKYKLEISWLWDLKTIWWEKNEEVIHTVESIRTYLSKFNWVWNDAFTVSTKDNIIFSVELNLWWKNISFDLYPFENFYMRNIYVDWVAKNWSFDLVSKEEKILSDSAKVLTGKNSERFTFSNFFINTFLDNVNYGDSISVNDNPTDPINSINKQDIYILVFKRDKLFSNDWEFYSLKKFSDIWNDNVQVEDNNWTYKIKLNNVKINFTNWAYISSDYIFTEKNHYFDKIKLRFLSSNWIEDNIWENNIVYIDWKIQLFDLEKYLSDVLANYNNIKFVNVSLLNKSSSIKVSIDQNRIVRYTFDFQWKNYIFYLKSNEIISIKWNWKELIKNPFEYTSLKDYINLLVK